MTYEETLADTAIALLREWDALEPVCTCHYLANASDPPRCLHCRTRRLLEKYGRKP